MASGGFSGGGPDFYNTTGFGSRSITTTTTNTNTNNIMNMNNNNNNNNPSQQQPLYRSQLPAIYLDQTSQISNRAAPNFMGKRTLSEFQLQHQHQHQQHQHQQQQQHHQNPALANLFLRHVKPRMYQNISSPISPLSPIDFPTPEIPSLLSQQQQQRFGIPLLQQLRPQPIGMGPTIQQVTNQTHSGIPYMNSVQQNRVQQQDSEKKMMNQLLELEKQLLDDNDEDEGDAVSVITNTNSEWSETIQNLISVSSSSSPKQISLSPTSSSSSSSSSSTVASPVSSCSKQTLMEAASAISEGKTDVANEILTRVGQVSNPIGNSEQRLMEYLLLALKSRGNSFENPSLLTELYTKEHVASTQLLYDISPCFKLGFMAANLAILEATLDQPSSNKFHVVDFDIGQGGQYMNLLHALSGHPNGKAALVKITAVADNEGDERLRCVGDVLCKVAEKVGVSLEFNVVVMTHKLGDLSRDSLGCDPDEPLAVNFAFKLYRMPDESVSTENPRDELLRRVKGLSPRVVTLVEQEMNTNTAPFMGRVGEVCSFYGALFDSIESTVARDNSDRVKVEEGLGRKLANSVACEGRERVERCEVFGKWRARMGMAGFELKQLSQNVAESMRIRLSSRTRVNPGFTVKEENGGVCFGWMGRTLTVASAWR